MKRRRTNTACLQETIWKGHKVKELTDGTGNKLYYIGKNIVRNRVQRELHKDLKEKIVKVKRLGENIIAIELVLEEDIMHLIGVTTCYGSRARARTFHGARSTS